MILTEAINQLQPLFTLLAPFAKWITLGGLAVLAYFSHIKALRERDLATYENKKTNDDLAMQKTYNQTILDENQGFKTHQKTRDAILQSIDYDKLNPDQRKLLFTDPNQFLDQYPNTGQFEKTDPGPTD